MRAGGNPGRGGARCSASLFLLIGVLQIRIHRCCSHRQRAGVGSADLVAPQRWTLLLRQPPDSLRHPSVLQEGGAQAGGAGDAGGQQRARSLFD